MLSKSIVVLIAGAMLIQLSSSSSCDFWYECPGAVPTTVRASSQSDGAAFPSSPMRNWSFRLMSRRMRFKRTELASSDSELRLVCRLTS
ncbi:hypothetical protein PRIPAC_72265 [Pristionchus pacificus]|uniref:Uncharacterized protein n=1 Tax=Pristionchus pacificus TaxID=54126 RepID=A0A2A6C712_PRIPA|nr:hypothetical protein PRIPAC_72265 [Pristionchus pacificus]|eukprot:PDM73811.1 hypothetical protein PRIPAC_41167 [Pristionchus pacificus]